MVPLGTSYAASAFTGYFLGQRKIDKAKKYGRLTILFSVLVTIVILIVILSFHKEVASLFTDDRNIVKIVDEVLYSLLFYVFMDGIHGV